MVGRVPNSSNNGEKTKNDADNIKDSSRIEATSVHSEVSNYDIFIRDYLLVASPIEKKTRILWFRIPITRVLLEANRWLRTHIRF